MARNLFLWAIILLITVVVHDDCCCLFLCYGKSICVIPLPPPLQPKAVSPNIKMAPASAPLSEGERKHCHQILYNYLHGKLDDPITAGAYLHLMP